MTLLTKASTCRLGVCKFKCTTARACVRAIEKSFVNDGKAAVEVNGDETLLLELVSILGSFRPDAPALAKVLNERAQSLTALFELGADTAMKFARNQVQDVQQASKDTMRANFTSTSELNQLQDRLDQMRLQIDRVSARIERLEQASQRCFGRRWLQWLALEIQRAMRPLACTTLWM